ncbi:MAG: hypothetical protein ACTHXT_08445 [Sphingobacterium sp.]
MKNLYFEASGFTGYKLLDPDQPIFVIASHDLEEDVAEAILRKSFPSYKVRNINFPIFGNQVNDS